MAARISRRNTRGELPPGTVVYPENLRPASSGWCRRVEDSSSVTFALQSQPLAASSLRWVGRDVQGF